ncbi:hypothetical protein [Bradyrhizobium sp. CCBAU 45394]|uniref:hypothetical protein n=1 Tax=Bradyrhizobium sp. CCBAU 45394 TaxID=1325087 RepID=UPI003FA4CF6A
MSRAIGQALKDFNISEISKKAELQRTSIYRASGNEQLPNFSTVLGGTHGWLAAEGSPQTRRACELLIRQIRLQAFFVPIRGDAVPKTRSAGELRPQFPAIGEWLPA